MISNFFSPPVQSPSWRFLQELDSEELDTLQVRFCDATAYEILNGVRCNEWEGEDEDCAGCPYYGEYSWSELDDCVSVSQLKGWCRQQDRAEILSSLRGIEVFAEMSDEQIAAAPFKEACFQVPEEDRFAMEYYLLRMIDYQDELILEAAEKFSEKRAAESQGGTAKRAC
jgi:hypothetical protein